VHLLHLAFIGDAKIKIKKGKILKDGLPPGLGDVASWRQFLEGLGVTDFLPVARTHRTVRREDPDWRPGGGLAIASSSGPDGR